MSILKIRRIKTFLERTFDKKIDLSNVHAKTSEDDKKKQFLTRAFTAYSLTIMTAASAEVAANSITDGYDDNGLDAIYFDRGAKNLWLVQSKFSDDGKNGVDNGDVEKFTKGVKRLLVDANFTKFNKKIAERQDEILEALDDSSTKIQILFAHTGQSLSRHNKESIEELLKEQNGLDELLIFNDFNIEKAYRGLEAGINSAPINEDILVSNWGHIDEPFKSYYGQISGSDLGTLWVKYERRLFTENIRNFLGNSIVNEEIVKTIKNEPENFIYFNNGITILCESIRKKPIGGNDKSIGAFTCNGLSVVNGAQTLGSIGTLVENTQVDLSLLKVFVKFISLEDSPTRFGQRITIATNTQNKVDRKDFVSLNSEQARLRIELKLENIDYHFKRTDEKIISDDTNYILEEVAFSLASSWHDVDYSTMIKKESGKLWEDVHNKPYTDLFNDKVSAQKVIKAVKIFRYVANVMKGLAAESEGRERSINLYGNAFVTHIVCKKMPIAYWSDTIKGFDDYYTNELPSLVSETILSLHDKVEQEYSDSMIVYVLRNYHKCRRLDELIMGL